MNGCKIDHKNLKPAETHPLFRIYDTCWENVPVWNDSLTQIPHSELPVLIQSFLKALVFKAAISGGYRPEMASDIVPRLKSETEVGFLECERKEVVVDLDKNFYELRVSMDGSQYRIFEPDLIGVIGSVAQQLLAEFDNNLDNVKSAEAWEFSGLQFSCLPPLFLHFAEEKIGFTDCVISGRFDQQHIKVPIRFTNCEFPYTMTRGQYIGTNKSVSFYNCSSAGDVNVKSMGVDFNNSIFGKAFNYIPIGDFDFDAAGTSFGRLTIKPRRFRCFYIEKCEFHSYLELTELEESNSSDPGILFGKVAFRLGECIFYRGFSLDDSSFKNGMLLSDLKFGKDSSAPTAYHTEMHDRSRWGDVRKWPVYRKGTRQNADQMIKSYEHLRHEMNKKQKHGEEKEFYRLEMLCRLRSEPFLRQIPNFLFWVLSDYGLSVWRPALFLLGLLFVFWILFLKLLEKNFINPVTDGFKLSASSILGPFGMRREIFARDELAELSGWVHFLMGLESVIGVILIFLIGLALRNQFRMRF